MSVTANIETRYRTNVLSVPILSVTTRVPAGPNDLAGTGTNILTAASTNGNSTKFHSGQEIGRIGQTD